MKTKSITAAAAALLANVASAQAADLPSLKAPPVPPPPPPTWTGFYLGLNGGYAWTSSNAITQTYADTLPGGFATNAALGNIPSQEFVGNSGFIGGGQAGFNWQFESRLVIGLEADIGGLTGGSKTTNFYGGGAPTSFSRSLAELGTVRARLGFAPIPALLVYATGGLAYGQGSLSANYFGSWISSGQAIDNESQTLAGYAVGGGAEWLVTPNWGVKAEYLYYDLGSLQTSGVQVTYKSRNVAAISTAQSSSRFNGQVVRLGVNYHINWGGPPALFAKH
ncbi:MAG TPA: outer membrane beta-barrel protein [Methylocystis sp.]|nr:outer membrane beta-barrel protein [Methylocystis sp.]